MTIRKHKRLTPEQRQEVKDLLAAGYMSQREIARRYGVSQPYVAAVNKERKAQS